MSTERGRSSMIQSLPAVDSGSASPLIHQETPHFPNVEKGSEPDLEWRQSAKLHKVRRKICLLIFLFLFSVIHYITDGNLSLF